MKRLANLPLLLTVFAVATPAAASAEDGTIPTVTVLGSYENAREAPGSAHYLDTEEVKRQNYQDVNRILRRVPGVYVREEDGLGLFPNISLRGVDNTRSAKVTLMEDGVLTAPAPYSAPSAYYSPTAGRMSALEILKGSSQVKYGPHSTGGVVNYISTPIPFDQTAYGKITYGSDDEILAHTYVGAHEEFASGTLGYLVEGYFREFDGFKSIDETASFTDGDDTGLTRYEPMVKLSWQPKSERYQVVEAKFGYTDMDANVSYLGLTDADFAADPYRRYTATRFDNIETTHLRTYLRHFLAYTDDLAVTTTAYYNKFHRNWFKVHDVKDGDGNRKSLSEALAEGGEHLAVLRGMADGELRIRNNNRDYYLGGVESVVDWSVDAGGLEHDVEAGVRYHYDKIRRNQRDELFGVDTDGAIARTDAGTQGNAGNRKQETHAVALYAQDTITIGDWTVTPGIRFEHLEQEHFDFAAESGGESDLNLVAGGIGATYAVSESTLLFGGVHRGVSPPDPRASDAGLDEESSIAGEFGVRYTDPERAFAAEAVGFVTHFDDLIVIDNIGGAGSGNTENVGEVISYGIEASTSFDLGAQQGWSFSNPFWTAFTWTKAECDGDANSEDPESLFSGCKDGNDVPYVPEFQVAAGAGLDFGRFGADVEVQYVDSAFTTGSNTSEPIKILADGSEQPDARFGKTDDYVTVDVAGFFEVREGVRLVAGVGNLFDEDYIVSRHPHGPRPGRDRYGYGGVEFEF